MTKDLFSKIPILPLTALIIYLLFLILGNIGLIPSTQEIITYLESLYTSYGLVGLSIATFFEGIVYIGLYFPGSTIIILAILFSENNLKSIFLITLTVAIVWTITSILNYLLGILMSKKKIPEIEKKNISKGFLFSFLHQNALAFYFFNEGIRRKNPWKLLITFPIMFIWGFFLVSLLSLFKNYVKEVVENPLSMILLLIVWFIVNLIYNIKKENSYTP